MDLEPLAWHPGERHDHDGCTPRAAQGAAQMGIDDMDAKVDQVVDKAKDFLEEEEKR